MTRRLDIAQCIGKTYGSWTIVAATREQHLWFDVVCKCGVAARVQAYSVLDGRSTRCRSCARPHLGPKGGHGATRGGTITPEFNSWRGMIERCTNPNHDKWARYGGRGITVCARWLAFEAFLEDMGPRPTRQHSIERRNNDKGYGPDNCHWATRREQDRNKSTNRLITVNGETLCLADLAARSGVSAGTIHSRLQRGVPPELAIAPVVGVQQQADTPSKDRIEALEV